MALAAVSLGAAGWFWFVGSAVDRSHPAWRYVEAAAELGRKDGNVQLWRPGEDDNHGEPVDRLPFRHADRDPDATTALRDACQANIEEGDASAAELSALRQAQEILVVEAPESGEKLTRREPQADFVATELREAIRRGRVEFYRLTLVDPCDEDGDVVEIAIDGKVLATVPLARQASRLSIPVVGRGTSIALKGVKDGGGGITVAVQTSAGQFVLPPLQENGEYSLAAVLVD